MPLQYHPNLLQAYFRPLEEPQNQEQFDVKLSANCTLLVQNNSSSREHFISDPEQVGKYAARIQQLEDTNAALSDEYGRQRKQPAVLPQKSNPRGDSPSFNSSDLRNKINIFW